MKIAILTMAYRRNYGGILQCVALQNVLAKMGHEVEVIHFLPKGEKGFEKMRNIFGYLSWKEIVSFLYDKWTDCLARCSGKQTNVSRELLAKCGAFISKHIAYTEICDEVSVGRLVKEHGYDALVIGSDKIWGGLGQGQLVYFADWSPSFCGKIISYAACSSRQRIPAFNKQKITRLLSRFAAISVRDRHTYNLIQACTDKKIEIVADPTLLYDFKDLLTVISDVRPYVFVYILGSEIKCGHASTIKYIKDKNVHIPVKAVLMSDESTDIVPYADEVITDASPAEWLSLLAHAAFVYTDSFHGLMFSLKYHKPFLGYYGESKRASRLIDLRDFYGLEKRIVASLSEAVTAGALEQDLDYESIQAKMDSFREHSLNFLKKTLID